VCRNKFNHSKDIGHDLYRGPEITCVKNGEHQRKKKRSFDPGKKELQAFVEWVRVSQINEKGAVTHGKPPRAGKVGQKEEREKKGPINQNTKGWKIRWSQKKLKQGKRGSQTGEE